MWLVSWCVLVCLGVFWCVRPGNAGGSYRLRGSTKKFKSNETSMSLDRQCPPPPRLMSQLRIELFFQFILLSSLSQ